MTLSYWQRKHTSQVRDLKTDVVIIGGGLLGLSTAFWLTELRPELKICILERRTCGAGASGKNAGFLTKGSAYFYQSLVKKWGEEKALSLYHFAQNSLGLLQQHVLQTSPELKCQKTHSLTLVRKQSEVDLPASFDFRWQGQSELAENLRPNFQGAFISESEFQVNPLELLQSLKNILHSRKVDIIEHSAGYQLLPGRVLTDVNSIEASKVVLALNGYSGDFHPALHELIFPRRAQMLAVELEPGVFQDGLHYDPAERVYFRKTQDNLLIIGGKRLLDEKGEIGSVERISPLVQQGLENYLSQTLNLRYKVINRWSGIMGFTAHELPYVEWLEAPLPTVLVAGFSGHGMGLGFNAAREAVGLVLGENQQSFFAKFRPGAGGASLLHLP